jgi:hypothetical protein
MSTASRERPIDVFISGRISAQTMWARDAAADEILKTGICVPWRFETAPASSEPFIDGYLRRVADSDLVVWLISRDITDPVLAEIRTALQAGRPILAVRIDNSEFSSEVSDLIARLDGRWSRGETETELRSQLKTALWDELARSLRQRPPHTSYLQGARSASITRCLERWCAVGLSKELANELAADDVGLGVAVSPGLTILVGPMGSGKSLTAERLFQKALADASTERRPLLPLYFEARFLSNGLQKEIDETTSKYLDGRYDGVFVLVDGLDESQNIRRALIVEARRLATANPRNVVVLTDRADPRNEDVGPCDIVSVRPLADDEAMTLMSRVAEREVRPGELLSLSSPIYDAVHRPLFAILAAQALGDLWRTAQSPTVLIQAFVERSLGRETARRHTAEPTLRRLAIQLLDTGSPLIDQRSVGSYHELAALFRAGFVVEKNGQLGFPLAILTHWFAAHAIAAGEVDLDAICSDRARTERWRDAIELHINMGFGDDQALRALIKRRPGMASEIIEHRDQHKIGVPAPGYLAAGEQLLDAIDTWGSGIGLVARLTKRGHHSRRIGIRVVNNYVETTWRVDDGPPVTEINEPMFSREGSTAPRHIFSMGAAWRSSWHRGLVELRSDITDIVRARGFPTPEPLLPDLAWQFCRDVAMSSGQQASMTLQSLEEFVRHCSRSGTLILKNHRYSLNEIHERILPYVSQQPDNVMRSPWPGPDRRVSGDIVDVFFPETIFRRTVMVYEAALRSYMHIVSTWLNGMLSDLDLARRMPADVIGVVSIKNGKHGDRWPSLTYSFLPPSNEAAIDCCNVGFKLGTDDDAKAFGRSMLEARRGYTSTILSDVFAETPAMDLTYRWLENDLRRLKWLQ